MREILCNFRDKHFVGKGNILDVLKIAAPAIISQFTATMMMFTDRVFMSRFGGEYLAAIFIGGFTLYAFFWIFWMYTCGYTNAIVAQYFGAKKFDRCSVALTQGFILAFLAGILVVVFAPHIAKLIFDISKHDPIQFELQMEYLTILSYGTFFFLLQISITGFFIGIGKPKISMIGNIVGMLVNIPLNYIFVFGKLGFPEMRIKGVAIATIISTFVVFSIMFSIYLRKENREKYKIFKSFVFDSKIFVKLLRFGLPGGVEMFINMSIFNIFMQFFMGYGLVIATAASITHSWNIVAIVPILGLNQGQISLIGRSIGGKDIDNVYKIVASGLKIGLFYVLVVVSFFIFMPDTLIDIFLSRNMSDYIEIVYFAKGFLYLTIFFILTRTIGFAYEAALRGSGDTSWVMKATTIITLLFVGSGVFLIGFWRINCFFAWSLFVCTSTSVAIALFLRFKTEKWKKIHLI